MRVKRNKSKSKNQPRMSVNIHELPYCGEGEIYPTHHPHIKISEEAYAEMGQQLIDFVNRLGSTKIDEHVVKEVLLKGAVDARRDVLLAQLDECYVEAQHICLDQERKALLHRLELERKHKRTTAEYGKPGNQEKPKKGHKA